MINRPPEDGARTANEAAQLGEVRGEFRRVQQQGARAFFSSIAELAIQPASWLDS